MLNNITKEKKLCLTQKPEMKVIQSSVSCAVPAWATLHFTAVKAIIVFFLSYNTYNVNNNDPLHVFQ